MIFGTRRKRRRILPMLLLLPVLVACYFAVRIVTFWYTPADKEGKEVMIRVPAGSTLLSASNLLVDSGVIKSTKPFVFMVKLKEIFRVMCEVIEEGVKGGEFRKVDVLDASSILGAMIRGFYFRGPIQFKEYSIEESTDLLHNFFLNGIKK